jgi:CopG family transcriptional regulator/antitoxin EndoAI
MAGPEQYSDPVEDRAMAPTRVRSLSLPSDLVREAERLAKQEGRTKTEVLREALRRYGEERRWRGLQRYGAGRARKVGLRETDVEGAIQEFRRGR